MNFFYIVPRFDDEAPEPLPAGAGYGIVDALISRRPDQHRLGPRKLPTLNDLSVPADQPVELDNLLRRLDHKAVRDKDK